MAKVSDNDFFNSR